MKSYVKRYAPVLYDDNNEMQALYTVQALEYEKASVDGEQLFKNRFILTSNEDALKKYEEQYGIHPNYSLTLEQRKIAVQNKTMFRPPFTRQRLLELINRFYGEANVSYELLGDEYTLIITVVTTTPLNFFKFTKDIRNLVPANIKLVYNIQYTYLYLDTNFTHRDMSTMTYGDLSRYAHI